MTWRPQFLDRFNPAKLLPAGLLPAKLAPPAVALAVLAIAVFAGAAMINKGRPGGGTPSVAAPAGSPAPLRLSISPVPGARKLPVSTEIGLHLTGGAVTDVTVTKAGATARIKGALRDDASSWVPAAPLTYATTYRVSVTARGGGGSQTRTTSFTTMNRPGRETGTGLYLFTGQTYGVAMPVVVEFNPPVPASARAGVQRRLFVTTDPPQPGVWHWASGGQVWYRAPDYWKPGTKLRVRVALGGHPTGGGRYGDTDRSASVTIGSKVYVEIDNRSKRMRVYRAGRLLREVPVSLGKASTPSSSGNMVIMSKDYSTIFDTTSEPGGGYRVSVNYAMRLTWGGEFIHAAPWSVGDQGRRNVSHGCVNISTGNARWLFGVAHVGDPVTVRGTEVAVTNGNGWTAWNIPWSTYVKGSALPVPPALAGTHVTPDPMADPDAPSSMPSPASPAPFPASSPVPAQPSVPVEAGPVPASSPTGE